MCGVPHGNVDAGCRGRPCACPKGTHKGCPYIVARTPIVGTGLVPARARSRGGPWARPYAVIHQ